MRCPYCLENSDPKVVNGHNYRCGECDEVLPRDYVESRNIPKGRIGIVGFAGHGKTCYLTALFHALQKIYPAQWRGFYLACMNEYTGLFTYRMIPAFQRGELPPSTASAFPQPTIYHLNEIPQFGRCILTFYDTRGEVFEQIHRITGAGRFVAHADCILFIVSLTDCTGSHEPWHVSMKRLLDTYVMATKDYLGAHLKRQRLVVVLTKADLLIAHEAFSVPETLRRYLIEQMPQDYGDPLAQWRALPEISGRIERWLAGHGAAPFVNMVRAEFKSVRYTMVSATGAAPAGRTMGVEIDPNDTRRVIDPLLCILEGIQADHAPWRTRMGDFWFKFRSAALRFAREI